uniref:Uncharacterized protein n=1 Tax=Myoviridae sp. ctxym25 TaxID=2825210 RepID=A0A8S5QJ59_9CAUD|nr:MAG TPA: hypothetical protein [Myoviridae sp. ctxym25]
MTLLFMTIQCLLSATNVAKLSRFGMNRGRFFN